MGFREGLALGHVARPEPETRDLAKTINLFPIPEPNRGSEEQDYQRKSDYGSGLDCDETSVQMTDISMHI